VSHAFRSGRLELADAGGKQCGGIRHGQAVGLAIGGQAGLFHRHLRTQRSAIKAALLGLRKQSNPGDFFSTEKHEIEEDDDRYWHTEQQQQETFAHIRSLRSLSQPICSSVPLLIDSFGIHPTPAT
jgi:hypothetical protein